MSPAASNPPAKKAPALWPFFLAGLVMLLLFWGLNKWLVGLQGSDPEPEEAARAELRTKTLAELRAEDAKKLDSYAWVDREKGSVQIPVAAAMELVLPELNASEPRPAYPVATPAPAAPTPSAPAAASTPAP